MRDVEFRNLIADDAALRVRFSIDLGTVVKFVVQLECLFDQWREILRYDTAHGFAHCDILFPDGEHRKVPMATRDYNEALTIAISDISSNWLSYRERYMRWRQERDET